MKLQKTLGALAALATIALASAADAAIVYTYKGTISGGTDYAGLLGGPLNQALDGKAFTLTFTLDPTSPDFLQSFFPGGESAGVPSGSTGMTGVISIDGVSLDLLLTDDAVVIESQMVDPPYASSIFREYFGVEPVSDGSGDIYMEWAWVQVYSENNQIVPTPVSYASPFTYTVQPGECGGSSCAAATTTSLASATC